MSYALLASVTEPSACTLIQRYSVHPSTMPDISTSAITSSSSISNRPSTTQVKIAHHTARITCNYTVYAACSQNDRDASERGGPPNDSKSRDGAILPALTLACLSHRKAFVQIEFLSGAGGNIV